MCDGGPGHPGSTFATHGNCYLLLNVFGQAERLAGDGGCVRLFGPVDRSMQAYVSACVCVCAVCKTRGGSSTRVILLSGSCQILEAHTQARELQRFVAGLGHNLELHPEKVADQPQRLDSTSKTPPRDTYRHDTREQR